MRPEQYPTSKLVQWLEKERILTLDRVAEALGRPARITLFRKLAHPFSMPKGIIRRSPHASRAIPHL